MENKNLENIINDLIREWNIINFSKEKLLTTISQNYEKEENYETEC